ncbi:MAG TPA: MBL fold metallo-hydrolase [Dehalococcoidia bacterium]|nr:MBL fold metallo-hydrolase [Dehalococcoidia bacterium]
MAAAEEIFPYIYAIPGSYVNMFLLAEADGLTLIDSGLKGADRKVWKAVKEVGRKPGELKHVLVTHHHADHCGALAAVKTASQATTYIHPIDAPIMAGEQPRPRPNPGSIAGKVAGPLLTRLPANNPTPVTADELVNDGDVLPMGGGICVIHTPGHTMGHVSFYLKGHGGILFTGDAAAHMMGRLGKPALIFTEDMAAAKESMRKLAALEFNTACFGHGSVLKGGANLAFRRYVEKMAQ